MDWAALRAGWYLPGSGNGGSRHQGQQDSQPLPPAYKQQRQPHGRAGPAGPSSAAASRGSGGGGGGSSATTAQRQYGGTSGSTEGLRMPRPLRDALEGSDPEALQAALAQAMGDSGEVLRGTPEGRAALEGLSAMLLESNKDGSTG